MKKIALIASGNFNNLKKFKKILLTMDYIICADGGANNLKKIDLKPNLIVGDLDSIDKNNLNFFREQNIEFLKFPSAKDSTDSELCVDIAIDKKPNEIYMFGFTGSRLDHTLANINLLKKINDNNIIGFIIDDNNKITIANKDIKLEYEDYYKYISFISLKESSKITLKGLKYPLKEYILKQDSTICISNEFDDKNAQIKINDGLVLIIKSRD
ncbi:MAG: thiamine diphosphokinase [Peptostreptococcaceae bacterium]|jgi:thiamine pyrophosphokinase|nr:thiamine diphosphokinase [Peptostreptococcaceae bacterium]